MLLGYSLARAHVPIRRHIWSLVLWCFPPPFSGRFVEQVPDGREIREQNTTEGFQAQESSLFTFDLSLHLFLAYVFIPLSDYTCACCTIPRTRKIAQSIK